MPDTPTLSGPSPPRTISGSPSIFAYQARILQKTSSTTNGHRDTTHSHSSSITSQSGLTSLAAFADASPPSTPIRQNVAKMTAIQDGAMSHSGPGKTVGLGLGLRGRSEFTHGRINKSVDLVRGQWESKINEANEFNSSSITPKRRNSVFSPPLHTSSTMSTAPASPAVRAPSTTPIAHEAVPLRKTSAATPSGATNSDSWHQIPASVSYTAVMSPTSTGGSGVASARTQAVEDTLAVARANALKRQEARKRAKAGAADIESKLGQIMTEAPETLSKSSDTLPGASSPFSKLFEPPSEKASPLGNPVIHSSSTKTTQLSSNPSPYHSVLTPPSESSTISSHYMSAGLSAYKAGASSSPGSMLDPNGASGNDKYGSISRTDRRRLGRHLPRIASDEGGWENDESCHNTAASGEHRMPTSSGRISAEFESSEAKLAQTASRDETL
ncbi:MAG: hypothetical protein TREMPRED_005908, partial [Tremellales sp. Tagirdzhanova-0007]